MNQYWRGRLIILRCCRDWPCHESEAIFRNGRCGLCLQIPEVIDEDYFPEVTPTSRAQED